MKQEKFTRKSDSMEKVYLDAENIIKSYKNKRGENIVLDNLSLHIEGGKFYAVVGESGSGKSTLLSILSGLQKPNSGSVIYKTGEEDGIRIDELSDDQLTKLRRHDIVYIPQTQDILPYLTVGENIRLVDNFDEDNTDDELSKVSRLSLILEELGITELEREYPSVLSGGELRRLCIARTLYSEPKIILADEPTNDLDKDNRDILRNIFRTIANKGVAVVVVTHDPELASAADEVIRL